MASISTKGSNYNLSRFLLFTTSLIGTITVFIDFNLQTPLLKPITLNEYLVGSTIIEESNQITLGKSQLILTIYLLITSLILLKKCTQFYRLNQWIKSNTQNILEQNIYLVNSTNIAFSLGSRIFVSSDLANNQNVIVHEKAHVTNWHQFDKIFTEFITCIFWFVLPVYWFVNKWNLLLEMQADNQAIKQNNKTTYQHILLETAVNNCAYPVAFFFNKNHLKTRIMKLNQKISLKINLLTFISMFLLGLFATATSCSKAVESETIIENYNKQEASSKSTAEFPGGEQALFAYLGENTKYPKIAKDNQEEGVVFVNFKISESGKVEDVKVLRGVSETLDAEALRVVSEMPDWNPSIENGSTVKTEMNLPIRFSLK